MFRRKALRTHCRTSALIAFLVIGVGAASPADSRVLLNTIDPVAGISDDGRHLVVTGPISCTAGGRVFLRATVTQRTTGALAEGTTLLVCTGDLQEWEIHASTKKGRAEFAVGAALAVAEAHTMVRGAVTDAHQWLVPITLVDE